MKETEPHLSGTPSNVLRELTEMMLKTMEEQGFKMHSATMQTVTRDGNLVVEGRLIDDSGKAWGMAFTIDFAPITCYRQTESATLLPLPQPPPPRFPPDVRQV